MKKLRGKKLQGWIIVGVVAAGMAAVAWLPAGADPGPDAASDSSTAAPTAAAPATQPSSDQVMQSMEKLIDKNPVIQPTYRHTQPKHDNTTMDPAVLGTAPGEKPVKLRREGEFIVGRLGRITHSPNGSHILFVFEADSQDASEPPMILLPCETLQSMEDLVQERGDRIVFKLSGQILTYRGANYLLPTTMILENDKANLQR